MDLAIQNRIAKLEFLFPRFFLKALCSFLYECVGMTDSKRGHSPRPPASRKHQSFLVFQCFSIAFPCSSLAFLSFYRFQLLAVFSPAQPRLDSATLCSAGHGECQTKQLAKLEAREVFIRANWPCTLIVFWSCLSLFVVVLCIFIIVFKLFCAWLFFLFFCTAF